MLTEGVRRRICRAPAVLSITVAAILVLPAHAQVSSALPDAPSDRAAAQERGIGFRHLPRNILQDQQALFTSPLRMRGHRWMTALPLVSSWAPCAVR